MEQTLDVGIFLGFDNPPRWPQLAEDVYRSNVDDAVLAEELGFDSVWLSEHHFDRDGWTPSPLPLAAGIATRTERVRIGTFLLILPLHHALHVAEDAATVDILSNGRLDLGVGQGYRVNEFAGFGVGRETRGTRLEEAVEVIRKAWTEDHFSYDGTHYQLTDVNVMPRPVQRPHPPIWIGARSRKAIERAARLGCHLMGTGKTEVQAIYDKALVQHGRRPEDHHIAQVLAAVHVAESRDRAWDNVGDHVHHFMMHITEHTKQAGDLPEDRAISEPPPVDALRHVNPADLPFGSPVVGTPDDCIEAIQRLREETRLTHLAIGFHLPGVPAKTTRESLELFAHEVLPHIK